MSKRALIAGSGLLAATVIVLLAIRLGTGRTDGSSRTDQRDLNSEPAAEDGGDRLGAKVSGSVCWPDGSPAAGLQVLLSVSGEMRETETDGEGRFALRGEGSGEFVLLVDPQGVLDVAEFSAPDYAPPNVAPALRTGKLPQTEALVVHLEAGSTLSGRVVDPVGKGVPGVLILAGSSTGHEGVWFRASVRSDESGGFELRGVAEQAYSIEAIGIPGGARGYAEDVAPGSTDVKITLQKIG